MSSIVMLLSAARKDLRAGRASPYIVVREPGDDGDGDTD
jgi:hypothetical protein